MFVVMDIIKLQGTDKKLYELIAPLVLNPAVLRQNNNYPFKTGPKYTWYIAIEKEQILGFIPIKQTSVSSLMINNYYIKGDNLTILDKLLSEILANINSDIELFIACCIPPYAYIQTVTFATIQGRILGVFFVIGQLIIHIT